MSVLGTAIAYIVNYSWVLFVVVVLANIKVGSLVKQREFAKAKKLLQVSFWCSAALTVILGVVALVTFNIVNLIFAAIWVYFTRQAWIQLKMFS